MMSLIEYVTSRSPSRGPNNLYVYKPESRASVAAE